VCEQGFIHSTDSGDLWWVEMGQLNFVIRRPKFTKPFSSNAGRL